MSGVIRNRIFPFSIVPCLYCIYLLTAFTFFSFHSDKCQAEEIAKFQNTASEGHIEFRYIFDERIDSTSGIETLNQKQSTYEEEFFIMTHNYIYHPNLMKLDLGGGFTLVQDSFESNTANNDNDDVLYNFQARANILEKKPYPLILYFTRDNPASFSGLAERIQQTNTKYGANLSLLEPLLPFRVNMQASHFDREGVGATQIIDNKTDRYSIRASKAFSKDHSIQVAYEGEADDSASGSRTLPITPTSRSTDTFTYNSQRRFGEHKQFRYFDTANYSQQDGPVASDEIRFSPNLMWEHSDKLKSSYTIDYLKRKQNALKTTNQSAMANLNLLYNDRTTVNGGFRYGDNSTTGQALKNRGANAMVTYKQALPFGNLTLSAGLNHDKFDRDTTASLINVIGESLTLSGLTPAALGNDYISTATIVVQNTARSQTFVSGVDYKITVVGTTTRIERLSSSSIGDPETVIVDYAYQTGGDVVYTSLRQDYQANLSFFNYHNLYIRYNDTEQDITSGTPTLSLNSQDTLAYGASTDYPVSSRAEVGASADFENHNEDISSYNSESYSIYTQFILPYASNLRLSATKDMVNNHNSPEDVDRTGYSVLYRSRPLPRMILTAEARKERDIGGTTHRYTDSIRLNATWRIYSLILGAQANFSTEQTGATESERTQFFVFIRREID